MTEQNRNLILAMLLSLLVFIGWEQFVMRPQVEKQRIAAQQAQAQAKAKTATPSAPAAPVSREAVIGKGGRVRIQSATLRGSINLTGARLDDLTLTQYRETLKKESPAIVLLSPSGTAYPYFLQSGWLGQNIAVPDDKSIWQADGAVLTPATPVTLRWTSPQGVTFTQKIAMDDKYLFTITHGISNAGATPLSFTPYSLISRRKPSKLIETYVSREGAVGSVGSLKEVHYSGVDAEAPVKSFTGAQSWFGMFDHYWFTAILPNPKDVVESSVRLTDAASERYQTDIKWQPITVAAGGNASMTVHLFAGAKEVATINRYQKQLGLTLFDRSVGWGLFYPIEKAFFALLQWLYGLTGNFGLAIIGLTVIVKAALFPLAHKGYQSMSRMKLLQPKIKDLQERYKDDKVKLQQAQIELFKTEKINPLGGCLPILLQIPVFFALYKVLFISLEIRHQPFFGWIKDLSAPDPLTPVNLFGLLPFTPPTIIAIGVLPILYAITFHFQMKLQPQTGMDPIQQKVFSYMPWIFMFMFATFSSGLVLYWTVSNTLSILQQWVLMRLEEKRMGAAKAKA